VLTLDDVLRLPAAGRAELPVGTVARHLADIPAIDDDERAIAARRPAGRGPVLVTREGMVLGVLTARGLIASAERARQLAAGRAGLRGVAR